MVQIYMPLSIATDRDLSEISKAIYFLFVSRMTKDREVQIHRKDILTILRLADKTYYNHLQPLLDRGLIYRQKQVNSDKGFNVVIFTIPAQPGEIFRFDNTNILRAGLHAKLVGMYIHVRALLLTSGQLQTGWQKLDYLNNGLAQKRKDYLIALRKAGFLNIATTKNDIGQMVIWVSLTNK